MPLLSFLIAFPLVAAVILLLVRSDKQRHVIVKIAAAVVAATAVITAAVFFKSGTVNIKINSEAFSRIVLILEIVLCGVIAFLSFRAKRILVGLLSITETALIVWFELAVGESLTVQADVVIDHLVIIMILIVGIIGSTITVYALGYMKDFQEKEKDVADRRPFFFFVMYLFLAAMFGLVLSNNLLNMYFCWEVTSFSSFLLIGYTGTKEAEHNSFRALWMNLLGGLAFAVAIVMLGCYDGTVEISRMIILGTKGADVVLPAALLVFAGLTKAAQMPFSSWLVGAMVAPTPTSALLHSSTMVKAGVFLIIRLGPVLGNNMAGILAMFAGSFTFLFASFAAISQSNGKKVLAYSTISNLGLIVCCAGIGTFESEWTAIMLVIFHAVSKSLMFLTVGTAEHHVGSRNIECFDGLFTKMPQLATCMVLGICAMFLAPFGMLISKWAAIKAFVDSGHALLLFALVFGSAATLFFWAKWLGKITAIVPEQKNVEKTVHGEEWFAIKGLSILTVITCVFFPMISSSVVVPYLKDIFHAATEVISEGNLITMSLMVIILVLLPVISSGHNKKKHTSINLSGVNAGSDVAFRGSISDTVPLSLRNWYLEDLFGEKKVMSLGNVVNIVTIAVVFSLLFGGMFHV